MKKITEQTFIGQLSSVLSLVTLVVGLFGGLVLLAADTAIDEKYASDADLQSVQRQFSKQVNALTETVNRNTKVTSETSKSVQALALTMVTIQIQNLEVTIKELEGERDIQGGAWSAAAEKTLRGLQRTLQDFELQRRHLFQSRTE